MEQSTCCDSPTIDIKGFTSEHYSPKTYPNIATTLHILFITPVTIASTERAYSALKFIKSDRWSTMGQDRPNALLLLYVHKDIVLDYEAVNDIYASHYPRRMELQLCSFFLI